MAEMPAPPDPAPLPMEHAKPQPSFKAVRMKPLIEEATIGGDDEAPDFAPTTTATPAMRERSTRRRSTGSKTSVSAGAVFHEVVQETEAVGALFSKSLLHHVGIFWREFAHPLWLPLLGLVTLGTAFTVPVWLAVPDILAGTVLVHIRAWQDWVRITCHWSGKTLRALNVERAFAVVAVLLGMIALLYRVVVSGAGHLAAFDIISVAFSVGGAASAWCKPTTAPIPRLREVPSSPLLLLFLAISTLAPAPGLASLPYALLFLALLVRLVRMSGLHPLNFGVRLGLLFLTTCHIVALLGLSFLGEQGAHPILVDIFGNVGRAVASNEGARNICFWNSGSAYVAPPVLSPGPPGPNGTAPLVNATAPDSGPSCRPGTEVFWPGLHVTALLLLHFVLTNATTLFPGRKASERPETPPELTTSDGLGAKTWTKSAVRWGIFANLVALVLWFPSLMSLPLLVMAFSLTAEKSSLMRCFCGLLRRCCKRRAELSHARGLHWRGRYVCVYMGLVFITEYIFNISQGELPGKPRLAAWLNDRLHLENRVHWPQPVVTNRRTWLQCIGLEAYGTLGAGRAASVFFPQAVILTVVAAMQSMLDDPQAPRPEVLQMIGKTFERVWFVGASMVGPEVSMVAVLIQIMMILNCQDGSSSVMTIAYMSVLVVLMTSKKLIRAQLWLLLQCLAEMTSFFLVLVYIFNAPSMVLAQPFDKFITVRCTNLGALVAPHLGIALVAGLQRLVIFANDSRTSGRARSSTVDSVFSSSEASTSPTNRVRHRVWMHIMEYLDRKAIRRMKLLFEELLVLAVMILSLAAALLPPVDVHSLALLAVVGPALLIYNFEDDREKFLLRVLQLLQMLTAFFLFSRVVVASPLFPLPPADHRFFTYITMQELGINQPIGDHRKPLCLGFVTILTRVAIREARMAIYEIGELESEQVLEKERLSIRSQVSTTSVGLDGSPEEVPATQPASLLQSMDSIGAFAEGPEEVKATHRPGFFGGSSIGRKKSTTSGDLTNQALTRRKIRRETRLNMGPRWEERMIMKWAPNWLPLKAHAYISAILLVMSFGVSITEVHLLNFLMIAAVVGLCGWSELWVQAGNVFSVTTVKIMLVQYIFRFQVWEGLIPEFWFRVLGFMWTDAQVVRHCSILSLCLLQKQLWHRGRYSKPRAPNCPSWLSRHAELIGMAALLLVAVARRHSVSPMLALAALPWLVGEEAGLTARLSFLTKGWLRFFRLILMLTLMSQVIMKLLVEFKMEERVDPFFDWHCALWEADVTVAPGNNATLTAPAAARLECIREWRSYSSMLGTSGAHMLWEFLALFLLGMVQQLYERRTSEYGQPVSSHWKLLVMHWWIVLVYGLTLLLSLEGGTIVGMTFLGLLLAVAFHSGGELAKRRRWVWRCQLVAWFFLFAGLVVQSPLLPCGRAACHGEVHRTFMPRDQCAVLQELNVTIGESSEQTKSCGSHPAGKALGHDTLSTLAMQVMGFRRVRSSSFWDDLDALLGSQLGILLQLILACAVQIRISNSRLYREKLEQGFVAEGEQLAVERARRFVHEFYCRCRIEEMASRERRRALRDKLKRVMRKINEILAGKAVSSVNAKDMDDVKHQILEEELQLSHGVKKEVAREVTAMFDYDMSLSKEYLDMMHLVMLGRVQPDSQNLQRDFERMQQNATKSRLSNSAVRAAQQLSSQSHEGLKSQGTEVTQTNSSSSLQSRQRARLRGIQAWCRAYWQSILEVWEAVKRSKHVSKVMCDYAFLCTDEVAFTLRKPSAAAAEELHAHRQHNGPLRLLWKVALSNMAPLVAVAAVLAFIETRSMIDVARAFVVFFVALHSYPFPPKQLWRGLLAFNVAVLALRTFYDMPVLCAGPSLRARVPSGLAWEPDSTVAWCPPNTHLTVDVTFGVAKRRGASALDQSSWFWAVWADHLCIWTVLLHQWMLAKSGLWDHVYFDQETKQCFLHDTGEADASCALADGVTPPSPDLPSALRAPKLLQLPGEEVMELDMDARHRSQVIAAVRVKDRLISEYYDMLAMQEKKRRARREHHNLAESNNLEQTGSPDRRDTRSESASSTGTPSKSASSSNSWMPSNSRSSAQLSAGGGSSHQLMRGVFGGKKAFTRGSMLRLSWLTGEHADRTSRVPEECELYLFCLDGDEEQVDYKIHELIKIQRAVRHFLERQRKAKRIRCLMGHPLKKEVTLGVVATSSRNRGGGADRDYQVCERCSKMISTSVRYSCKECDYHACADCVQTLLALDQGMGKQDGVRERIDCRPGIAVYWLKYLLGLVLLCYFLIANTAIFSSESRSTLEAVQANNISTHTLSLLTVHLLLLITDRVFHKWHYRNSDSDASLKSIETLNLLFLLAEFFWVHTIIISELWNISNIREIQISLFSEWALCLYYLGWMTYLGVCIAQRKYGLPAVDHDTLRPTAPPESFGITMEKFYTFSWYAHYALPFVDDLRVIIDWSVMPTSLDLWMHFKVEDAHSWLFRTRHAMYIRRQSFFAERRDSCEKVYSGWVLVLLLIFIILMPLLIFSPITPFTSTVGIDTGNVVVELGVATACINGQDRIECRFSKVQLFKAVANQIITYNDSRKTEYLSAHPSAPSTDIDIDEVEWPAHSLEPLQISHPVGREIQGLLDAEVPRLVYFRINLELLRTGTTVPFYTTHTVCFCAPEGSCTPDSWHWPPSAKKFAQCTVVPSNHNITRMQNFWRQLGKGESPVLWPGLQKMWDGKVRVGTTGADKQGPPYSVDLSLNNCSSNCNASWCGEAHCWGKLDVPGHSPATVIYELERSATLNALSTSSTSFSVIGLYLAVVLVAGRYLRAAFQDSSKRAIYEEIPDVGAFLDLVTAIKLAREHRDLRTEFQLYYCLMKVLRSTNLLLTTGGHEPRRYGAGRTDDQPPECEEPRETRLTLLDDSRDRARSGWDRDEWSCPRCEPKSFAL